MSRPIILNRNDIEKILSFGHIIPISKGYTAEFVEANYPAYDWNTLIKELIDRGVLEHANARRQTKPSFSPFLIPASFVEIRLSKSGATRAIDETL